MRFEGKQRMPRGCLLAAGLLALVPVLASAQVVHGRVTEEGTVRPLIDAEIQLLDAQRQLVFRSAADVAGRYSITTPTPGNYYLIVDRIGFQRLETPLLSLAAGDTMTAAFELPPDPIELEGLRVEADRLEEIRREAASFGIRIDDIGERFVSRERIEARPAARSFGKVLQWQTIPRMRIIDGTDTGGPPRVCVMLRLNRDRCALNIVNGALVTLEAAAMIPPEAIEAIVVMEPHEATTLWGTDGGGGAVLIFTR